MNQDVQIIIFSFLQPDEIIHFYNSCDENACLLKELSFHPGLIIKCTTIVSNEIIEWFKEKNIQLDLFKQHIIYSDSEHEEWLQNGELHRDDDLPAIILNDRREWYQFGELHRDNDQPAMILNGRKLWYQFGKLHRDNDLPAKILNDRQEWYQFGELHRDNNLPAIIWSRGYEEWYKYGVKYHHYIL
jgi:hypothetical protein